MDKRLAQLRDWLSCELKLKISDIQLLAGDASFRRYFRVYLSDSQTFIAMDAPPQQENCHSFVIVANYFAEQGICVPKIIATCMQHGFLLLSDLGDELYLNCLNKCSADKLYKKAIESLLMIQRCKKIANYVMPSFDRLQIQKEFFLFKHWYLQRQLQLSMTVAEDKMLDAVEQQLCKKILQQPQIFVHRDYHSRNLLLINNQQVGILDFQDAVWGPISYDLVSLLKDCYIAWPREQVLAWVDFYYKKACALGVVFDVKFEQFLHWFDWMGLQRHLKAIGIFARLGSLYARPRYLQYIPRTLAYVKAVVSEQEQLSSFCDFLTQNTEISAFDIMDVK